MTTKKSVLVSCKQDDSIRKQEIQMILDNFLQQECGSGVSFTVVINGKQKSIYLDKDLAYSFIQNCLKQF